MISVVDFFAGCGGLSYGFSINSHFQIDLAVDIWSEAARVYSENHPNISYEICDLGIKSVQRSLVARTRDKVDVVIGGPPCQGFSTLGKRRDGDHRSTLVEEFAVTARKIQPKIIIMENVVGIRSKPHPAYGTFLEAFRAKLSAPSRGNLPYDVHVKEINCLDFGMAQARKRVIAVAFRTDLGSTERLANRFWQALDAEHRPPQTLFDVIGSLPRAEPANSSAPLFNSHVAMRHSPELIERLKHIPPGGGLLDVPERLLTPHLRKMRMGGYGSGGHVKNIYGRLEWDKPSGTIVAGIDKITCGRYIHPVEHRLLTPRECARIQSFPDNFIFSGSMVTQYYLIGNAVPPSLSSALATATKKVVFSGRTAQRKVAS